MPVFIPTEAWTEFASMAHRAAAASTLSTMIQPVSKSAIPGSALPSPEKRFLLWGGS
jgi:hypothetical protein